MRRSSILASGRRQPADCAAGVREGPLDAATLDAILSNTVRDFSFSIC
jgi:hypothetical protein